MSQVALVPKATLDVQFLPRCPNCGGKHPMAYRPPILGDHCPQCLGEVPLPGETQHYEAELTSDPQIALGQWLIRLGRWLGSKRSK